MEGLEQIIELCKAGKRDAQGKLYNLFAKKMFGVCLYYSKDRTEAEDMLHEGFIKVFRYISQFEGKGSFEGWVKRIMINTSLEKYRKHTTLYPVEDVFEYFDDVGYNNVVSSIDMKDLLKMVQELTPRYRMVFNLYAVEGYNHKEIGEMMGISEGTSKSNLSRARVILQNRIKNELMVAEPKNKMIAG